LLKPKSFGLIPSSNKQWFFLWVLKMFTRFKNKNNVTWLKNKSIDECVKKLQSNNTSGFNGVYFHKSSKKWRAVGIGRERKTLGNFEKIEDAINARKAYESDFYAK